MPTAAPTLVSRAGPYIGRAGPYIGRGFASISPAIVDSVVGRITRRVDPFERIERFGELRDAGFLTEEEFSA
jgi:hypothetical protein